MISADFNIEYLIMEKPVMAVSLSEIRDCNAEFRDVIFLMDDVAVSGRFGEADDPTDNGWLRDLRVS